MLKTTKEIKENLSNEERITMLETVVFNQQMLLQKILGVVVEESLKSGVVRLAPADKVEENKVEEVTVDPTVN